MKTVRLLLALALVLFLPSTALAEERILAFLSDIEVQSSGDLVVTETIRVRAEGDAIRRGIFREIPTVYDGGLFRNVQVPFEVLGVERNGQREPWATESMSNGVRIRIGDADVMLDPGVHDYRIRYRIGRQLGFFDDFDELYWNVTGTGWRFPIDVAEARVRLPAPADFGDRHVYTGLQGARGTNAAVVSESEAEIVFRTTAPLAPYEGLTIAVAWPKGIVTPPKAEERLVWWLGDYGPPAAGLVGLASVVFYYIHAWRVAGRNPRAGTIVPIFAPPDDLSPAGMRYVTEMGADNRGFAAALIDLGVRGHLRLVEGEKRLLSKPKTTIEKRAGGSPLAAAEAAMLAALFSGGDSIVMENENHQRFSDAQSALAKDLKKRYEGKLFLRNFGWSLRGLAVMTAAVWLTAVAVLMTSPAGDPRSLGVALLSALCGLGAFWLLNRPEGSRAAGLGAKLLAGLLVLAAIVLGAITIGLALGQGRILPLLIPLLALPVVVSAFWWMHAPTRTGRAVLDRIAGFRQYLSITEEERLQRMHPPEKTPELFEKYLPYAIALEVENEWADRFAGVLATASVAAQGHAMGWYSGHSDPWRDPGGFADRVGSSLSSTVASASTAPGSSSGSGGGGSSGGGGGGGGGGGW